MKDESKWDDWKRKTVTTVDAHGCENVIDENYVPSTPDEIELFKEQNKFMYNVFVTILQTPMGMHYVREQETTCNAQKVWINYCNYMKSSTKAHLQLKDLMTELISLQLTTNYSGTTMDFIVKWLDKMHLYERLTKMSEHFTPGMKKTMLQNAISELKIFKEVKQSELLSIAYGEKALTYEKYIDLLQCVAGSYDKENSTVSVCPHCTINYHSLKPMIMVVRTSQRDMKLTRLPNQVLFLIT